MIDESRLTKALVYLAETDERAAELCADMERAEYKSKAVRDAVFLAESGTVAERTAKAGTSEHYQQSLAEYFTAVQAYNAVKNKRQTESLVIDVWRSMNANRRQAA